MGWRDWRNKRFVVPKIRSREGWRVAGDDVHTCVAPAGFEKDPAVTEAIRSFDPEMVPAWRIQLWHPPDSDLVLKAVHHGIMRYYPYPRNLRQRFHVELPQDWRGEEPNFLDVFFSDERKTNHIGPAAYMPWDWHVYRFCRAQYVLLTSELYEKRVAAHRRRMEEERAKHQAELEYRRRDFEKTAMPILETVTPKDWEEYAELRRTRGHRARRLSLVIDPGSPPGS
jgi:hypothetical protein